MKYNKERIKSLMNEMSERYFSNKLRVLNRLEVHIYPTPPLGQDMTQGHFFKRSLTGLNSEFSFS